MATTDMTDSTAFELSVAKSMPNHLSTVPVSTEFKTTLDLSLIGRDLGLVEPVEDGISSIRLLTEALSTEDSFLTAVQNQPDLLYIDTIRLWTLARACAWGTIKGQAEQRIIRAKADAAAVASQETIEALRAHPAGRDNSDPPRSWQYWLRTTPLCTVQGPQALQRRQD